MKEVVLWGLCLFLMACVPITETTKPSFQIGEKAERDLTDLSKVNPILADELRKLPELKKGLDGKGILAVNRIVTYYTQSQNPEEVKQIFDRILSIGKKERRKFSAPLQALFWLAEENEIPLNQNPLKLYSSERYRVFNKHLGEDEEVITFVYNVWRRSFHTDKWKDPNEIIDRLNSPHLFDLFFRDNIAYDHQKSKRASFDRGYYENWGSYLQSAKVTIQSRKGTCQDAANLADEILSKVGYDVRPLQVKFRRPTPTGSNRHWIGVLKEGGLFYKIADDYKQFDGIVGPFKSVKEVAEEVARIYNNWVEDYSLSQVPIR